jgi:hypothetical protein
VRATLAVVLVAGLAHAEPDGGVDVPRAEPHRTLVLEAGSIAPPPGPWTCLDDAKLVETGQRIAYCEASLKASEGKTMVSTPVLVAAIVGALVLGLGVGAAAGLAASRLP